MIGMSFIGFLTLFIIGLIASMVMHFIIRYNMLKVVACFFAKWIGGWLGSPVLGYRGFHIQNVYIIPAFVGAFIGAFAWPALVEVSTASQTLNARTPSPLQPRF